MALLTRNRRLTPEANCRETLGMTERCMDEPDHMPVVRISAPVEQSGVAAAGRAAVRAAQSGQGLPEAGYVSLSELEKVRGSNGPRLERTLDWAARGTLSECVLALREAEAIIELAAGAE